MSEVVAIIPARGGSKGVPRKNVLPLCGKPLIAWNIDAAWAAEHVTRVVVSTDDLEIATVSRDNGAEVIDRPAEISGDLASSESALLHAIKQLETAENAVPDITVFLQCTSPLTSAQDIDGTVQVLLEQHADSALAVTDFHYFLWHQNQDGDAVGINHAKTVRLLRQQQEPQYLETGSVYAMRTKGFLEAKHRFFGRTAMYVIPPERCLEIDEPVDYHIAEMLLRERGKRQALQQLPVRVSAVVFDFDGVFTDNRVLVTEKGEEAVQCHRGDGWGLRKLKQQGVALLVLSTERNPVVEARCRKLCIPCIQGTEDKKAALTTWCEQQNVAPLETVFVGNDENDVSCLRMVACGVVPSDAHLRAKAAAKIVLTGRGGFGAVREVADLITQHLKAE